MVNIIKIKQEIIEKYLDSNLYIDRIRYLESDSWIDKKQWIAYAKNSIENENNILKALDILIVEEFDNYYDYANEIIQEWYDMGAYDANYYYDILAFFPNSHPIREDILGDYLSLTTPDSWGWNKVAREALIRAKDMKFCKVFAQKLNREIKNNSNNYINLEEIILRVVELGEYALELISIDNLNILKEFVYQYIAKDKEIANRILKGEVLDTENERTLWIMDDIAYITWSLQWFDILNYLIKEDWYWLLSFDEEYGSNFGDNNNLLIWSLYTNNYFLETEALKIVENNSNNRVDGVIALHRLNLNEKI